MAIITMSFHFKQKAQDFYGDTSISNGIFYGHI